MNGNFKFVFIFALLLGVGFSVNITSCGSYSATVDTNFYVSADLFSNGTCLQISSGDSSHHGAQGYLYLQNHTMTVNGSGTAIAGSYGGSPAHYGSTHIIGSAHIVNFSLAFSGIGAYNNVDGIVGRTTFQILNGTTLAHTVSLLDTTCGNIDNTGRSVVGWSQETIYVDGNFGKALPISGSYCLQAQASVKYPNTTVVNITANTTGTYANLDVYGCNFTNPSFYNYDYFPNTEVGCTYNTWYGQGMASFTMKNTSSGASTFLHAIYPFYINGNITGFMLPSVAGLVNLTVRGKNIINSTLGSDSMNFYMYATTAAYLGQAAANTTSITNIYGKIYYGVLNKLNPRMLVNETVFPIELFIPATEPVVVTMYPLDWTYMKIKQVQGYESFLVYSSEEPADTAYLICDGTYVFEYGLSNGSVYTGRNSVFCNQYGQTITFSNVTGGGSVFNSNQYTGLCMQLNASISRCTYYTNDDYSQNWTMLARNLSNGVEVCRTGANGSSGTLYCQLNDSALVYLYNDNDDGPISTYLHSVGGSGTGMMWPIIYAGCALLLVFIASGVPLMMGLAQLVLTYLFWTTGLLPTSISVTLMTIWIAIMVGLAVTTFKQGTGKA